MRKCPEVTALQIKYLLEWSAPNPLAICEAFNDLYVSFLLSFNVMPVCIAISNLYLIKKHISSLIISYLYF